MSYEIKQDNKFRFIEEGERRTAGAFAWPVWST